MELSLDVNSEFCHLDEGDKFTFLLASTLNHDGTPMDTAYDQSYKSNLADSFDYVMHGKVFKVDPVKGTSNLYMVLTWIASFCNQLTSIRFVDCREVFASYGGLLMSLKVAISCLDIVISNGLFT